MRVRSHVGYERGSTLGAEEARVFAAVRGFRGRSLVWRGAATALLACLVALAGATPGWGKGTIRWHGCGADFPPSLQCGELSVPLDYARPGGAQVTLGF